MVDIPLPRSRVRRLDFRLVLPVLDLTSGSSNDTVRSRHTKQKGARVAKKVVEELIDDLDGTPADHTVRIGWNDEWREIELSEKNLAALSRGLDRFWDGGP